jgi:hypothetical protein
MSQGGGTTETDGIQGIIVGDIVVEANNNMFIIIISH